MDLSFTAYSTRNYSEKTKSNVKAVLSFFLYWWTFFLITLPLSLLKFLKIIPVGKNFYFGTPVIRYYWQNFMLDHLSDFKGDAIEIDNTLTIEKYGAMNLDQNETGLQVAHAIDIAPEGDKQWVADISDCWNVPSERYDLFLMQFTFHMIERDIDALYHCIRIIKPGGILLCNFPAIGGYFPKGKSANGYTGYIYRWYTPVAVKKILSLMGLTTEDYELRINGNWFSRLAYVGFYLPKEVIPTFLLKRNDPAFPLLMSVRIKKPVDWQPVFSPDRSAAA